jgi:hypothetical protein
MGHFQRLQPISDRYNLKPRGTTTLFAIFPTLLAVATLSKDTGIGFSHHRLRKLTHLILFIPFFTLLLLLALQILSELFDQSISRVDHADQE